MKNAHSTPGIRALLLYAGVLVAFGGAVPATAVAQGKKVIKTTTDSRGFEKQLTEVDLMYETARQFIGAGKYDQAAVELEKVMAADGSRLDALHDLGTCYKKLKKFDRAAAAYGKAVALYPEDLRLMANLGYYQLLGKDYEGATATYEAVLEKATRISHYQRKHLALSALGV